jgi:arylsulfatase A-like enzyme
MTYGLGSENKDIPGYVVLDGGLIPPGGLDNFKNGFLPASYQASVLRPGNEPIANISPKETIKDLQKQKLGFISQLDQQQLAKIGEVDAVESAISNYELAYKMQSSIPELTEFKQETKATKKLYGFESDNPHTRGYAAQCLLARRLVERGVRFIELTCPKVSADRWDQHGNLKEGHEHNAHAVDQPIAGLLKDLKSRGLLEETLVVWTGEFGRTPFAQGTNGRDHNPSACSMWMAGAGVKGGTIYGRTDDYGYRVIENEVTVHDLHATMMHLMGINHKQLTFRFGGRDMRLTDVHGHVIKDILS